VFTKTKLSEKSFILERQPRPDCKFSICTSTKGRMEARLLSRCWKETGAEVVVAEFGPEPVVFRNEEDLKFVDCYIFCYSSWLAPFSCSWWKNVPAMFAKGETLIQVDCDIAISKNITNVCKTYPKACVWPREIGQTRKPLIDIISFKDIKRTDILPNCEQVFMIRREDFLNISGWPEWYTGRKHTWLLLKHHLNKNNIRYVRSFPFNFFVHVPHLNFYQNQYNDSARIKIGKHHNSWTFEYLMTSSNSEWPVEGWKPGDPTLMESFDQKDLSTQIPLSGS
jgi:hypothetical protein